ncbi:MAG TPA: CsbD family protein [Tepidiformaceae bacterium]|nr:CsbD family protein [Tepidiformaceae bacterium]
MGNTMDDKMKGKANRAAGAVREKAGDVTGNEEMEAKGKAQNAKGRAQEATGKAKDAAGNIGDAARKAAGR